MASDTSQVPSDSPPLAGMISNTALITSRSSILVARGMVLTEILRAGAVAGGRDRGAVSLADHLAIRELR